MALPQSRKTGGGPEQGFPRCFTDGLKWKLTEFRLCGRLWKDGQNSLGKKDDYFSSKNVQKRKNEGKTANKDRNRFAKNNSNFGLCTHALTREQHEIHDCSLNNYVQLAGKYALRAASLLLSHSHAT